VTRLDLEEVLKVEEDDDESGSESRSISSDLEEGGVRGGALGGGVVDRAEERERYSSREDKGPAPRWCGGAPQRDDCPRLEGVPPCGGGPLRLPGVWYDEPPPYESL